MDRRQIKTRRAIFVALNKLLKTRRFDDITVQEIIDEAKIGRSTFYAHFETRNDLLEEMCTDIFEYIFVKNLRPENIGGSASGETDMEQKLIQVLQNMKEMKPYLRHVFGGENSNLFMGYLKDYVRRLFGAYADELEMLVPGDFLLHYLTGSFAEVIRWWMASDMKLTPEEVAYYFNAMLGRHRERKNTTET